MTRTRLRQLEQIRSSFGSTDGYHAAYDDNLNMGIGCEVQPGDNIGSAFTAFSFTAPDTIVVTGDMTADGVNAADLVTMSGGTNDGISGTVSTLSYAAGTNRTTITITNRSADITTDASPATTVQAAADEDKNLLRDLNFIRTQLRKLNGTDDWYDNPAADPSAKYQLQLGSAVVSDVLTLTGGETYDAGPPYTMKVFLNGQLLLPSVVSGSTVTTAHDYTERVGGTPTDSSTSANEILFNFAVDANDLIQLRWSKS